jgi:N-methylhydantoinase B
MISTRMATGETIYHKQPGGGGYGDPLERSAAAVAWDVKNDKVSIEAAAKQYGVVLDPRTLEVDQAGTELWRAKVT